jgi:hypothetical protein
MAGPSAACLENDRLSVDDHLSQSKTRFRVTRMVSEAVIENLHGSRAMLALIPESKGSNLQLSV